MKKLQKALKALGVTGKVTTRKYDRFTVTVYANGKKFGLWDIVKRAFVE